MAHLQLVAVQTPLQRHVDGGEEGQRQDDRHHPADERAADRGDRLRQRHGEDAGEVADVAAEPGAADAAENERQQARLQGVDELLLGQDAAEPGDRIEHAELGHQRLQGPGPAAHRDGTDHAEGADDEAERKHAQEQGLGPRLQLRAHGVGGERMGVEAQRPGERVLEPRSRVRRDHDQRDAATGDRRDVAEIARARDLPFLARLLEPPRGRGMRLVLGGGVGHVEKDCFNAGRKLECDKGLESRSIRAASQSQDHASGTTAGA